MYRRVDRENEMWKNAEHLQSLALMEKVLDERLESLEDEYHWNCKKYIYLQALECDSPHLHLLATKLHKSKVLIEMLRSLLEDTFQEKIVFMEEVQNQQEQWKMEDEYLHVMISSEQHQNPSDEKYFKKLYYPQHYKKQNKKYSMLLTKFKSQRIHSKLLSLKYKNINKRKTSCVTFYKRDLSKFRKSRDNLPKADHCIRKTRWQNSVPKYVDNKQENHNQTECRSRSLDFMFQQQDNLLSDSSNDICSVGQGEDNLSNSVYSTASYQPIETEHLRQGSSLIWRQEEMGELQLFLISNEMFQDGRTD